MEQGMMPPTDAVRRALFMHRNFHHAVLVNLGKEEGRSAGALLRGAEPLSGPGAGLHVLRAGHAAVRCIPAGAQRQALCSPKLRYLAFSG